MLKTKTKVKIGFVGILSITAGILSSSFVASQVGAASCTDTSSPADGPAECNTTFQVNVVESLSVSLTTPSEWVDGDANTFLRNTVSLEVSTNNVNGFTASMYTNNTSAGVSATSDLINTSDNTTTIGTISSNSTRSAFPADAWGFSLSNYTAANPSDTSVPDTTAGNESSTYKSLTSSSSTPITVLYSDGTTSSGSQDIYFGAKASITKPSGTYQGTVVISAVSGVVDNDNPITPVNPAGDATNPNPNYATNYGVSGNQAWTTYTTTSSDPTAGTDTTTTVVSSGDNRSSYPLGVTESSINSGAPLATGLAVTAAVAATSGAIFFILAKRKKDDEEEEEEDQTQA